MLVTAVTTAAFRVSRRRVGRRRVGPDLGVLLDDAFARLGRAEFDRDVVWGSHRRRFDDATEGDVDMAGKKAKASAQKAKGKAKVVVGELTGSKKLKAKGNADKAKARRTGKEKVKDKFR